MWAALYDSDPDAFTPLKAYTGKTVTVNISFYTDTHVVTPTGMLIPTSTQTPDLHISGDVAHALAYLFGDTKALTLSGDMAFGLAIQQVLNRCDHSVGAWLARLFNDEVAMALAPLSERLGTTLAHQKKALLDSISDFLIAEKQYLTPEPLLDNFSAAVDTLRADTDRLEARLERLEHAYRA